MGLYSTMKFIDYLKEKALLIITYLIILIIIFLILSVFDLILPAKVLVLFLLCIFGLIFIFEGFYKRKIFYNELFEIINNIDNKLLITETMPTPYFIDGKIIKEIMKQTDKYKIDEINKYKFKEEDFKSFIEMWIHEIKTPLSTIKLICENNQNEITNSISEEASKINNYIEIMLFYSRSQALEKDYLIKETNLNDIINKVILNNKKSFIYKNINLDIKDTNINVKSDSKWLEFILNQIISNSIKYIDKNPKISIFTKQSKENIKLYIVDNGIGISKSDLPRVFDKGFTGQNGRKKYNSTGLGLYLVKELCNKLGHKVEIKSNDKTEVIITFPIGSYTKEIERN